MFSAASSAALLSLLVALPVLSDSVVAEQSFVTLPISRKLQFSDRTTTIVQRDRARVGKDPVSNQVDIYIASVGIGCPPTTYNLVVDTGSSNTWIGANKSYVKTPTSYPTGDNVSFIYGVGSFYGVEYLDQVTLAPGLIIHNQSIGDAYNSTDFVGFDGILGMGPTNLTNGTLTPHTHKVINTVTDNLFFQGTILRHEIGVSFEPTTEQAVTNGEIAFGGTDPSKHVGHITYSPRTTTAPASAWWGVNQSVYYGTEATPLLTSSAGIVDSGTTLILFATDAYNIYQQATGAVMDADTGFLSITSTQYSNLKSLFFVLEGTTFELTPNAQIWPRSLNTAIGGNATAIYLVVGDLGPHFSSPGSTFVCGYTFLERFYSVYDTANNRVGLAKTKYTYATSN